jgi:hypothetical protein
MSIDRDRDRICAPYGCKIRSRRRIARFAGRSCLCTPRAAPGAHRTGRAARGSPTEGVFVPAAPASQLSLGEPLGWRENTPSRLVVKALALQDQRPRPGRYIRRHQERCAGAHSAPENPSPAHALAALSDLLARQGFQCRFVDSLQRSCKERLVGRQNVAVDVEPERLL